jgi:hypothetical protein
MNPNVHMFLKADHSAYFGVLLPLLCFAYQETLSDVLSHISLSYKANLIRRPWLLVLFVGAIWAFIDNISVTKWAWFHLYAYPIFLTVLKIPVLLEFFLFLLIRISRRDKTETFSTFEDFSVEVNLHLQCLASFNAHFSKSVSYIFLLIMCYFFATMFRVVIIMSRGVGVNFVYYGMTIEQDSGTFIILFLLACVFFAAMIFLLLLILQLNSTTLMLRSRVDWSRRRSLSDDWNFFYECNVSGNLFRLMRLEVTIDVLVKLLAPVFATLLGSFITIWNQSVKSVA